MTNTRKTSLITGIVAVLVLGGVVGGDALRDPTGKSVYLCDYIDCPVCDPSGTDPTLPACFTDSGWLCCDLELNACGPSGSGECKGGIQLWCDYYETQESGVAECQDTWGQG